MKKCTIFLAVAILSVSAFAADMDKGPYLIYRGKSTQMQVLWEFSETQGCTLEWGTTTSYGSSVDTAESDGNLHKYVITGLNEAPNISIA